MYRQRMIPFVGWGRRSHRDRVRGVSAPPLVVVAGAIVDDSGRLLAARRSSPPLVAGRWELPGGKGGAWRDRRRCAGSGMWRGAWCPHRCCTIRIGTDWSIGPGRVLHVYVARLARRGRRTTGGPRRAAMARRRLVVRRRLAARRPPGDRGPPSHRGVRAASPQEIKERTSTTSSIDLEP